MQNERNRERIRIGIRPSPLARRQAQEALPYLGKVFPNAVFEIISIVTTGDQDKITPLDQVEKADFFTKEIDEALLRGEIDVAVHSSKDLPETLPQGLVLAFETPVLSPYDALVSRDNLRLRELLAGRRIGASSQRRKEEIRAQREDLVIVDIRGNIEERLALIDDEKVDAAIVAHAALIRLGLEDRIAEVFSLKDFKAHPRQGSLSLVVRSNEAQTYGTVVSVSLLAEFVPHL